MPLGGLAVSTGIMCIGAGLFVLGYPEQLVGVWVESDDTEDRPAGITARRWVQLRGGLAAVVGLVLVAVGFGSMFY